MIYLIVIVLALINIELLILLIKTGRQANKAKRMIKRLEWSGEKHPKDASIVFTRLTAMNKCLICGKHFTKGHEKNCFMGELAGMPWIKFIDGGKK